MSTNGKTQNAVYLSKHFLHLGFPTKCALVWGIIGFKSFQYKFKEKKSTILQKQYRMH